jgi:hypothetical protein
MKISKFTNLAILTLTLLLTLAFDSSTFAQGRGGGRPSGNPGNGGGGINRPTMNPGIDRGISTSSDRSNGRADKGRSTASDRSNGRSDAGMDRAREGGRGNAGRRNENIPNDTELNRYRGISRKLGTTPETLRSQYESALRTNPDLKFGQFVAANMIADNLRGRNSNITTSAILRGLDDGKSIGETLRDLGVNKDEAKRLEKETSRQIKAGKNQND